MKVYVHLSSSHHERKLLKCMRFEVCVCLLVFCIRFLNEDSFFIYFYGASFSVCTMMCTSMIHDYVRSEMCLASILCDNMWDDRYYCHQPAFFIRDGSARTATSDRSSGCRFQMRPGGEIFTVADDQLRKYCKFT